MTLTLEQIQQVGVSIALYKPLGQVQKEFHRSLANFKWLMGGNQSSKTYTNMMDLAMLVQDFHPVHYQPAGIHWVAIESWEQVRDILWGDYLSKFIPDNAIHHMDYGQHQTPRKLHMRNGHVVEFKAFNQGRGLFQGRAINSIHCDEQCHYDFQGIFNEMQARLLRKDGYMSWSMTPIEPQIELEERIEDLPDTDEIWYSDLNANRKSRGGYIEDDRIDRMINDWPVEVQQTRIKGLFASFVGAVFKTYSRAVHVCDPFRIPSDWRKYRAVDFGFTNPFVCLWLAQDNDENWYVYREYYKAQGFIQEHIRKIKVLSKGENYVGEIIADYEDAEGRAAMKEAGLPTRAAKKDINPSVEMIQTKLKVKGDGKPSLKIFRNCKNTAREFPMYHYPKGTNVNDPKDQPVKKNDHAIDCVRYCIYTTEKPIRKSTIYTDN